MSVAQGDCGLPLPVADVQDLPVGEDLDEPVAQGVRGHP